MRGRAHALVDLRGDPKGRAQFAVRLRWRAGVQEGLAPRHACDRCEVEILHVAVSTTRRALVGDELENKTEVQEQRLRLRTTVCVLLIICP